MDPQGIITTVAGDGWKKTRPVPGAPGFADEWERSAGDGGPATKASLSAPRDLALAPDSSLYIADSGNGRVRKVNRDGIITTVAGRDKEGYSGDGGPVTKATFNGIAAVALGSDGSLYIADSGNHRIRKVNPAGIVTTVVGCGKTKYAGDGMPATKATLAFPCSIAVSPDGSLYVVDDPNYRIRKVGAGGVISTAVGNGWDGDGGDGGPATEASIGSFPRVSAGSDGSLYIADMFANRIRKVTWR